MRGRQPDPAVAAARLLRRLEGLRAKLVAAEAKVRLGRFGADAPSARNLVHYLALRQFDLRRVQTELADLGLSSLGRAEGHVLHNLDAVLLDLYALAGRRPPLRRVAPPVDPHASREAIDRRARRLFGAARAGRATRIMVTAPEEAAHDGGTLRELLERGMDVLRINCAHDSPELWEAMIRRLRRAERLVGRRCPVEMDLGGPRLRTGLLPAGPAVMKLRPERDELGHVLHPAQVELVGRPGPSRSGGPSVVSVVVSEGWLGRRRPGERVQLVDARGARRNLRMVRRTAAGWIASVAQTSYLINGLSVRAVSRSGRADLALVSGIPSRAGRIRIHAGTTLRLFEGSGPDAARLPLGGRRSVPTVPVIGAPFLRSLRAGDRIWFDGGRLGGVVRSTSLAGATVRIDRAPPGGTWLRADLGINLPDTDLGLPPLTDEDLAQLDFVVRHADLVGYSFVQSAEDVYRLRAELRRRGRPTMPIVLKIETRRAFEQLPEILLAALRTGPSAVMLARGDLAVEVGFERLAEVQEELLWLAEAAHLPAIWATQVLEGLAKSGAPSRAEVTDAAMGERAECVMLNKGPYLVPAVRALDSIVRRMQAHQAKKSARLRHLAVAQRFLRSRRQFDPLAVRASGPT